MGKKQRRLKRDVKNFIANLGQWLACVLLTMGIIIEMVMRANIGYIIITFGSLVFAIFTKLKYYGGRK